MSSGGGSGGLRRALLASVVLLFLASIPWYRTGGAESALLWGLPDWVAVAIACYAGAAVLNALAWLMTDISDDIDRDDVPPGGDGR